MKLQSSISLISGLFALWLTGHAVPPVHAQDTSGVRPSPPTAADRGAHFRLQPQAADDERAPSLAPPPPLDITARRRHSALLITGIATFAASYVVTLALGGLTVGQDYSDADPGEPCYSCSLDKLLYIPVVGPWIWLARSPESDTGVALLGASQVLGLVLTLGGAFFYANSGRAWFASSHPDRFMFAAMPTPRGAQMALRLAL